MSAGSKDRFSDRSAEHLRSRPRYLAARFAAWGARGATRTVSWPLDLRMWTLRA
jgi:hypothetical protein